MRTPWTTGLLVVAVATQVPAQRPPTRSSAIDPSAAKRVVESVARGVEQSYLFPDTGRLIADHLRRRLAAGAYDAPLDVARFTDRLTADMQSTNGDKHLYVVATGESPGPAAGQPVRRRQGDPLPPDVVLRAKRANHNVDVAQRLPGNVGYLAVSELSARTEEMYRVLDAAMTFLERTDAMIIDLRGTRGGQVLVSDYLAGYFLGDSVRTLNSYTRSTDQTWERVTPRVKGTVRRDVPVYLLIGPGTASGAEDFAFIMKTRNRAMLIGGRTAGAGRLTSMFPISDGFAASFPGGRTYEPATGKEWERNGIAPDTAVPPGTALEVAHAVALRRLAAGQDPAYREILEFTARVVDARARPIAVDARLLRSYAGGYEQRLVKLEGGKLWYQRDSTRAGEELTATGENTFAFGEATKVEFVREKGVVTAMRVTPPGGPPSTFPRNP